ncbi:MAG: hypothetical protein PWP65_577 [Clostridia bacterium]|nr:hypothetical protein [Clostridia bacterium]
MNLARRIATRYLKNKLVISSLREGEEAWEESYAAIRGKMDSLSDEF